MNNTGTYRLGRIGWSLVVIELLVTALIVVIGWLLLNDLPGFRFERMHLLYGLLAGPLLVVIHLLHIGWRNRALRRFAAPATLPRMVRTVHGWRSSIRFLLVRHALGCGVIAAAGPQFGTRMEEVRTDGADIMVCVDVSNSMDCEDLRPSRMDAARRALSQLIDRSKGDRIGIVVFAGEAFVQLPITTDRSAARMFAASVDTRTVGAQGTAIGAAIDLARSSFAADSPGGKAILVISDGENHEDDADGAARAAVEAGCVVHTIGMGTLQGGPIPIKRNGQVQGFRADRDGRTVVSALNEDMLRRVAEAGNGIYVRAGQGSYGIGEILDNIQGLEKGTTGTYTFTAHEDRFQVPLALAIALLLAALLLPDGRPAPFRSVGLARLLPLVLLLSACGDARERAIDTALRNGEAFYQAGDLNAALEQYEQAPDDHRVRYNAGVVLHQLGRLEEAAQRFEQAAVLADSTDQRARAQYDLGHTWQLRATAADTLAALTGRALADVQPGGDITEQVRKAVMVDSMLTVQRNAMQFSDSALLQSRDAYRQALRNRSNDEDARHNLTQVQLTIASRIKAAEERRKAQEAQQGKDLTALARTILAKADSLVGQYAFDAALKTLQQGLQREPTLIQRKDYSDKLETVTNAARP